MNPRIHSFADDASDNTKIAPDTNSAQSQTPDTEAPSGTRQVASHDHSNNVRQEEDHLPLPTQEDKETAVGPTSLPPSHEAASAPLSPSPGDDFDWAGATKHVFHGYDETVGYIRVLYNTACTGKGVTKQFRYCHFRLTDEKAHYDPIEDQRSVHPILQCLPNLADASTIFVCQGEDTAHAINSGRADAGQSMKGGYVATTPPGGLIDDERLDFSPLFGKTLVLLPDNNESGKKFVEVFLRRMSQPENTSIFELDLPDRGEDGNYLDFVKARRFKKARHAYDELIQLMMETVLGKATYDAFLGSTEPSSSGAASEVSSKVSFSEAVAPVVQEKDSSEPASKPTAASHSNVTAPQPGTNHKASGATTSETADPGIASDEAVEDTKPAEATDASRHASISTECLAPQHADKLKGIAPQVQAWRGYYTATTASALTALGFPANQRWVEESLPTLVIPIWNVTGEVALHQIRPDHPRERDGKVAKYEIPAGGRMCLDVHPILRSFMGNPNVPLYITEGPIKADHAISQRLCCIALLGVWNWRGTNGEGGKTRLPDWEEIALNGRHVYVAFDSDWKRNPHVHSALERLVAFLKNNKAHVHVLHLSDTPEGDKVGLDDFFLQGGTVESLHALEGDLTSAAQCQKEEFRRQQEQKRQHMEDLAQELGTPVIETSGRQLCDLLEDLSVALEAMNQDAPVLFHGPGGLVIVSNDATGVAQLELVTAPGLQVLASRAAQWIYTTQKGAQNEIIPPRDVMENYLASKLHWRLPALERVAYVPFYAEGDTLCARDGYHAAARVWLQLPANFELPDTTPTPENLAAARRLLLENLLGEVAFVDDASRAHAVALMLQPIIRRLIDGAAPLYLYEAPTQSSGKSYAARLSIAPHTRPISMIDMKSAEEWEKSIFTAFLEGRSHLFFDNIVGKLNSPALASFLTEPTKTQRILGGNKSATVYTWHSNWVATANNATLSADAGSRIVKIRINTRMESPEQRRYHSSPERYIQEHRGEVFGALLTLVKAWFAAGRPAYTLIKHRFDEWSRIMGGVLEIAEIPGFLENLQSEREAMDPEKEMWREFVALWFAKFGTKTVSARELLAIVDRCDGVNDLIGENNSRAQRLGTQLGNRREQTFEVEGVNGGLCIERLPKTSRGLLWQLVSATDTTGTEAGASNASDTSDVGPSTDVDTETAPSEAPPIKATSPEYPALDLEALEASKESINTLINELSVDRRETK